MSLTRPFDPTYGAHARVDFTDKGKRYLAGQDYPLAGLHPVKIERMHTARRIDFGPPTEARAKKLAERLEKMTKPSAKASPAAAPPMVPPPAPRVEQPRAQGPRR